jgi:hypothetical protein
MFAINSLTIPVCRLDISLDCHLLLCFYFLCTSVLPVISGGMVRPMSVNTVGATSERPPLADVEVVETVGRKVKEEVGSEQGKKRKIHIETQMREI